MNQGDIRWYQFDKPDKKRPVLVLTRDRALAFLGDVTIAPITRTIRDIPSEVLLGSSEGLPSDCVANLDHIQTVSKKKVGVLIGRLSEEKMKTLRQAVLFALGLEQV